MAIDSALKRTALMAMGTPKGIILTYPTATDSLVKRCGLLSIGYITEILLQLSILDIEHTFEITRTIAHSFNVNKIITHTFKITG